MAHGICQSLLQGDFSGFQYFACRYMLTDTPLNSRGTHSTSLRLSLEVCMGSSCPGLPGPSAHAWRQPQGSPTFLPFVA